MMLFNTDSDDDIRRAAQSSRWRHNPIVYVPLSTWDGEQAYAIVYMDPRDGRVERRKGALSPPGHFRPTVSEFESPKP